MGLTLAQLIPAPERTDWLASLLSAAQGVGFVSKPAGVGAGTLEASGVASVTQSVRVKVTTAGELGTAQYALSSDGGVSYGTSATLPSNGTVVLTGTGVTLQFSAAPAGAGTSFLIGDVFALELSTPNLPVSSWQPGATPLTLMGIFADAAAEFGRTVAAIAQGGLLKFARGAWLSLLADSQYNVQGNPGIVSHRTLTISDTGGVGPVTLTTGELWVGTPGGLRWTNTAGGTVPLNSSVDLDFAAETVGNQYNVGAGVIDTFFTSFPGLAVGDPLGVATITTPGQDAETDDSIVSRCMARWPSLGVAAPNETYDLWAKTASSNVTRTKIRPSPTIPGQIEIYLAGAAGAVSGGTVSAVDAYLQMRLGTGLTLLTQSAAAVTQAITATVYCFTGQTASVTKDINQNLVALVLGGTDTEGEQLDPVPIGGTLYWSDIVEQLSTPRGVRNVVVTTPATDVALAATSVMGLGAITLNVVEVSS